MLWDVDGTLVDASEGTLHRLKMTLEHFGKAAPTRKELSYWIGPPMYDSFQANVGMSPQEASRAMTFYRELGDREGYLAGTRLYPGVADVVATVAAAGVPQATASSKPEAQVALLMDHFGLTPAFSAVVGASADEKTLATKADVVAESLRRLRAAGVDTTRPVLVGDRHHDVEGGAANGMPVIFARWGFGWPHEAEGAQAVADSVSELPALLLIEDSDG